MVMARSHGVAVRRSEPHAHPLLHFLSHPRRIGRMAPVAQLPELLVRHRRRVRPAVVTRRTWRMPRPRPLNRRSRPGRRQSPRYRGVSGRTRAARRRRRARSSTPRPSQGRVAAPDLATHCRERARGPPPPPASPAPDGDRRRLVASLRLFSASPVERTSYDGKENTPGEEARGT